jgi:HAMP domain-containing protein
MMNFILMILLLIAGVGWIIWRWLVRDERPLERAWRLVLEEDARLRKEEGL